ncbi:MAG: SCO family protein, partial [Cyclobacteriaceae bacterium]|nr:SCO family protein [Cyclobacteriaceae bacterium]
MKPLISCSILIFVYLWGCQTTKKQELLSLELPYYNQPDYTPEWIEPNDPSYKIIHTISPFELVNQNGDTITQKTFEGKVYVANFFFSVCPNVCPKMKKSLSLVQEAYTNDDRVKILSHTVMPWV